MVYLLLLKNKNQKDMQKLKKLREWLNRREAMVNGKSKESILQPSLFSFSIKFFVEKCSINVVHSIG